MLVLVADDIEASREALVSQVRALGHLCVACASGAQALQLLQDGRPDLLLLDLWMPDMDGFEVTRAVRAQVSNRWLPVIVTSALEGEAHFIDALSRGADDYLTRPVKPDLLAAKLAHYQRVLGLQASLTRLSQRERLIHEHLPDAVMTLDQDGRLCEANLAARALLAHQTQNEPLGQNLASLLGRDIAPWLRGDGVEHDIELPLGEGSVLPMAVSSSSWQSGSARYCTLVFRDQTERRRIERMKEEFLATVSHELRTPLTSIVGALGLLASGAAGTLTEPASGLLAVAQRNGERLSRLIDDVLDLTKLEGNRLQFHARSHALAPLINEALQANQGQAGRHGVALAFDCEAQDARAVVDADRFLQIMANLLSNAIKHTPSGAAVRVRLAGCVDGWRIQVQDSGPGIAAHFRRHLFEKFSQADGSDRRAHGGTGLGLYITRMLVERMGGTIGAEPSHPDQPGACFQVTFPLAGGDSGTTPLRGMGVARDPQAQSQWREWLGQTLELVTVGTAEEARLWTTQHGPVQLILADPTTQGSADSFCTALQALVPAGRLVLVGSSVDAAFAAARRLPWVAPGQQARNRLLQTVASLLSDDTTTPSREGSP